jgi:CBS domain-containing protein
MSSSKTVKDIMVDVFDFPHIPYWFTLRQAIGIVKKSLLGGERCHHPLALLVFDEKYNLLGTVSLKDILRGLEPSFLKPTRKAQVPDEDESGLALIWDTLFDKGAKEMAERPIGEVMVPAKLFVKPEDPVTKAAYLMVHYDLALLPVLENKKFVGVVRMIEIFTNLSDAVL